MADVALDSSALFVELVGLHQSTSLLFAWEVWKNEELHLSLQNQLEKFKSLKIAISRGFGVDKMLWKETVLALETKEQLCKQNDFAWVPANELLFVGGPPTSQVTLQRAAEKIAPTEQARVRTFQSQKFEKKKFFFNKLWTHSFELQKLTKLPNATPCSFSAMDFIEHAFAFWRWDSEPFAVLLRDDFSHRCLPLNPNDRAWIELNYFGQTLTLCIFCEVLYLSTFLLNPSLDIFKAKRRSLDVCSNSEHFRAWDIRVFDKPEDL